MKPRVLVLDDDPALRNLIARALGRAGFDAEERLTASEALNAFRAGARFVAIVCEIEMGQISGTQLLAELMEICPEQAARVIFLTTGSPPRETNGLLGSGRLLLRKPFELPALLEAVRTVCVAAPAGQGQNGDPNH